jgi:hypothetical protein
MATGIQRDAVNWLNSKLEGPWSSERVVSYLNPELLQTIAQKFSALDPGLH